MTPEQKIIAIAEFEGFPSKKVWRVRYKNKSFDYDSEFDAKRSVAKATHDFNLEASELGKIEPIEAPSRTPLYLTSRDAICGAVARLDDDEFAMWIEHLKDILHCGEWEFDCLTIEEKKNMFLATPAQLADALLLTLGHEI